ncbi:glycoside hydrolase family 2 TIM barrel-domain containing protein [Paenibacillus taichungensis]|uniref:glycoside hydrolase family 2 protein n=1 Tax=Paenibacillus taichungensis TaxID=484184 RepID=UPI002870D761|nr:sugar-binding domain-containing protein [Paenibacillus taichungensis]MDR9745722.1 glycoside hydrolase family 2 TIM barrel-domain containing protein [Paenibacillus taichungensis]MEC0107683.1 glycoside hydrolase family 2 TIM barrel-domain containing protein [Paenibacillus taichungensis]MEC0195879.1 glycoside hydrolase family 2 TIM barrel-domain containing protein [Paenibacillus taichungensis]
MTTKFYNKDYPRPQFVRNEWLDLNGEWDFSFDDNQVGESEQWYDQNQFPEGTKIKVPFTYETQASGIGIETFHPLVWYRRSVQIPQEAKGKRSILHFQGVDYHAKCWVNGTVVGEHEGGYAAFSFDITPYVTYGSENNIVLEVEDSQSAMQPRGKQRWVDDNFECFYVQSTGIWKSVWLEHVSEARVEAVKMTPDIDRHMIRVDFQLNGIEGKNNLRLETRIELKGQHVQTISLSPDRPWMTVEASVKHEAGGPWKQSLWSPGSPNLYDIEFVMYEDEKEIDRVHSYFGMRKISIENGQILLNNAPLYQRMILDQGYWTESHLTPPSVEALIEDIDKIAEMGYNGIRKHMKLEDPRFLYWCDVKGMLVWSEMAATFEFNDEAVSRFTKEWLEIVPQQYNHPSIITWVPFNESWGIPTIGHEVRQQQFTQSIYHLTKAIDPYRPVITNDGWEHTVSDILTIHDYVETGEAFLERYQDKDLIVNNKIASNRWKFAFAEGYHYKGQPIIISEFGGIAFQSDKGWGYGNQVDSVEAFIERFRSITEAIKAIPYISGYCYTQVTDVQQEINGLLTEDRKPKVPLEVIRKINLG